MDTGKEIANTVTDDNSPLKQRIDEANKLMLWSTRLSAKEKHACFAEIVPNLLVKVGELGSVADDAEGENQKLASTIARFASFARQTDQPLAITTFAINHAAIRRIWESGCALDGERLATLEALLNANVYAPPAGLTAPGCVATLLAILQSDRASDPLQAAALRCVQTLPKILLKDVVADLFALAHSSGNEQIIQIICMDAGLYESQPEVFHANLAVCFEFKCMQYSTLIYNISQKRPAALVPFYANLKEVLASEAMFGAIVLMALGALAPLCPDKMFPDLDELLAAARSIQGGETSIAKLLGGVAHRDQTTADLMCERLARELDTCTSQYGPAMLLSELSNISARLSSPEVMKPHLPIIRRFKSTAEVLVQTLEDFCARRSLENAQTQLDDQKQRLAEAEQRIDALNQKVAATCHSFEEVKAYVDANIAEIKEFIAEVAKKLPQPRRLEVMGKFRKTLRLQFACVRTQREFPIDSGDWSKWLKMGFSLLKLGKMALDIGMGNPLGLIHTGIDAIKGVYEAYRDKDDKEFNTYISQPFLTSAEQDQLIVKLREQQFFEKFSYDAQLGGWYLNNPDDGTLPAEAKGSVTRSEGTVAEELARAAAKLTATVVVDQLLERVDDGLGGGGGGGDDAGAAHLRRG